MTTIKNLTTAIQDLHDKQMEAIRLETEKKYWDFVLTMLVGISVLSIFFILI